MKQSYGHRMSLLCRVNAASLNEADLEERNLALLAVVEVATSLPARPSGTTFGQPAVGFVAALQSARLRDHDPVAHCALPAT